MARQPRVAIIGGGRIGIVHARNLADAGARVIVVEPDPGQAAIVGQSVGCDVVAAMDALEHDGLDGAVVCTPTDTHPAVVRDLFRHRAPILLEKPCCAEPVASQALGEEADQNGITLRIGFQRRFAPEYAALRAMVRSGEQRIALATFTSLDGAPPPRGYQVAGQSLAFDLQIHDVDLALWTFGTEIMDVAAIQVDIDGLADTLLTSLRFADGVACSLVSKRTSGGGCEVHAEIVGERTTFATKSHVPVQRYADFRERFADAYATEIGDFLRLIDGGSDNLATWRDAVAAEAVCQRIDAAVASPPGEHRVSDARRVDQL